MSLIYITGPTGAGKSTLRRELQERNYTAYDTDEDGIAEHQDRSTGEPIDYPSDPDLRTAEWSERHVFNLSRRKVEHLAKEAEDNTIFLCGAAYNDLDLAPLFGNIICLDIDWPNAKQRIATRDTNNYGKSVDELHRIRARHEVVREKYRTYGAHIIDATKPFEEIADEIIRLTPES